MLDIDTGAINCTNPSSVSVVASIDNISLVIGEIDPDGTKTQLARYIHMLQSGDLVPLQTNRNGYKRNAKFREEKFGERVLISTMPVKPSAAPLRIEFNPGSLGPNRTQELILDLVSELVWGGPEVFYEYSRVTRVDVAFDLFGLALGEVFVWSDGNIVSQVFQKNGMRSETIVQSYSGVKKLVVYDKAKEQQDKGLSPFEKNWTRVEARARSCGFLTNLASLKNPLLGFHLSRRQMPEDADPNFWVLLDAACGLETTQAVLQKMTPSARKKIQAQYLSTPLEFWDPQELWKKWPQLVNDSGLLDCKELV